MLSGTRYVRSEAASGRSEAGVSGLLPAVSSGVIVGVVLGLIGGGGSILAVPLLVYFVGVRSPHLAIGTSAVAVSISAAVNLALHARQGNVKWRCALLFAAAGMIGAWAGSTGGQATDGKRLLALFGALMIVIGAVTLRRRRDRDNPEVRLDLQSAVRLSPRLVLTGLAAGAISGYFGIGGGFLIGPGLMFATQMPLISAVGSSLVAVTLFGLTTAANYARSG